MPAHLRTVIQRCLAKDPAHRYQSARELYAALETAISTDPLVTSAEAARQRSRRWAIAIAGVGALTVVLVLALSWYWRWRGNSLTPPRIASIAVLPLGESVRRLRTGIFRRRYDRSTDRRFLQDPLAPGDIAHFRHAVQEDSKTSAGDRVGAKRGCRRRRVGCAVRRSSAHQRQTYSRRNRGNPLGRDLRARPSRHPRRYRARWPGPSPGRSTLLSSPQELAQLNDARSVDPQVYQLYLQGNVLSNQASSEQRLRQAIQYLEQAISKDPSFAPAHAALAESWFFLSSWYIHPREAMPKVRAAAQKALQLDDGLAEAHASMGLVHMFYDYDWTTAEKEFRRAIELNPSSVEGRQGLSRYFSAVERHDEAIAEVKKALEIDPRSLRIRWRAMFTHLLARRNDDAIEQARRALEIEPNFAMALAAQGLAYAEKRQFQEAVAHLEAAAHKERTPTMLGFLAHVKAAGGWRREAGETRPRPRITRDTALHLSLRGRHCICQPWQSGPGFRVSAQGHGRSGRLHGLVASRTLDGFDSFRSAIQSVARGSGTYIRPKMLLALRAHPQRGSASLVRVNIPEPANRNETLVSRHSGTG